MGYSARYHAASLAAVFLALAIGILIGAEFGDEVVSGTSESLEESLKEDVEEAQAREEELSAALDREREFSEEVYPVLVGGMLRGERVALIGLGGLPDELASDVQEALEPTGANLAQVSVVRAPPDTHALAEDLEGTRFARLLRDEGVMEELGSAAGRQLVGGGPLLRRARDELLSRFSGRLGGMDDVILVRDPPGEMGAREADAWEALESGLLEGVRGSGLPAVGVERTDAEESSVDLFGSHEMPTVDNLDLVSGRVSMAFVLLGAEGSFGVKESADQLLPDLLRRSGAAAGGR